MDQINSYNNLFTKYSRGIDFAIFLGSGLLATSYLTTWINDPLSKAGVVFATLLNAAILGKGNKVFKAEEGSLLYKTAVAIGCLGCSCFAASIFGTFLKERFGVVLTFTSSMQIAGINLATKAGTYALYFLCIKVVDSSTLKMPTSTDEITSLDKDKLKRFHAKFHTPEGKSSWEAIPIALQLCFASQFIKEQISIEDFVINWEQLTHLNVITYQKTIWHFEKSRKMFAQKCFDLGLPLPINIPNSFFSEFSLTCNNRLKESTILDECQCEWIDAYLRASPAAFSQLDFVIQVAYFNTKLRLEGGPLGGAAHIILTPHSVEDFTNASHEVARVLYIHYTYYQTEEWKKLSLEMQEAGNDRFVKAGDGCIWPFILPNL